MFLPTNILNTFNSQFLYFLIANKDFTGGKRKKKKFIKKQAETNQQAKNTIMIEINSNQQGLSMTQTIK